MKEIPFAVPMISEAERSAVARVLDGPILVHGPVSKQFEASFAERTGAPHAVGVSSCTAAMHLFYFGMGLGSGDEVIVPAETHTATAHAIELTGATPVFVDAEAISGNVDIAQIEGKITERTKAIAIVHFLGEPVAMDSIMRIAEAHDLAVVEDCALALGAHIDGVHVGLHGHIGCFSFYPVKHITTAEGGMAITRDGALAERLVRQRAFGVDKTPQERSVPGVYDVTMLGFNYRLNEIQAALGVEQLKRLDSFLARRRENFTTLRDALSDVDELYVLHASEGETQSSYYCLGAVLKPEHAHRRLSVVDELKRAGIGTSVYYPKPVPLMRYYRERYAYEEAMFPVATWISGASIALPVGPHLEPDDMIRIADSLKQSLVVHSS